MQEQAKLCAADGAYAVDSAPGRIRPHDAWVLELTELLNAMNAQAVDWGTACRRRWPWSQVGSAYSCVLA